MIDVPSLLPEEAIRLFPLPNGRKVYCDRPDKDHAKESILGFYNQFSPFLTEEMWAIDIGTSCGDSTVVMGNCLADFPNSKVIAFEPSREIYNLLLHNISQNPCVTYDVHTVAAGDSDNMIDFVYGVDNGGIISPELLPERGPCVPSYQVQVVNIYRYLRTNYTIDDLDKIKFIKIDTEGYDYLVLKGLAPLIYRNRTPIIVEWWNDPSNSNRMFDVIDSLYYEAYNSHGEKVNRFDFSSSKRTQDLLLKPI